MTKDVTRVQVPASSGAPEPQAERAKESVRQRIQVKSDLRGGPSEVNTNGSWYPPVP